MRSKLFVPGSRPEWFAKALAGEADAISIDLEDSVIAGRKAEAREQVAALLDSAVARESAKAIIVRVNSIESVHFAADIAAVARPRLTLLNVPKVESPEEACAAAAVLDRAEAAAGLGEQVRLLLNIETPRGLARAGDIARAHRRIAGLQVGYADLFEPFGIDRHDPTNVHAVMFCVRMAAAQSRLFVYDGAFADVADAAGFRAEAEMARRLGYEGKSCIHPSQVTIANEVFKPAPADIERAARVLDASRRAQAGGAGAFLLDGRMIDAPMIRRAEAILEMSRRMERVRR